MALYPKPGNCDAMIQVQVCVCTTGLYSKAFWLPTGFTGLVASEIW